MDMSTFKAVAYGVAHALEWHVGPISQPSVTPNFWAAELVHRDTKYYLLCSENNDWAVSSKFDSGICQLQFEDCEQLSSNLNALYGIRVLSKKELEAPFSERIYLSDSDVSYWKPKTAGDALFNWWD